MQRLPAITHARFSLIRFRSPLLTESRLFSLPAGTEMFHFPAFPPHALCVQAWVTGHVSCRVSPFGHPRIKARLTAPRGFSQPPTSFFGSWCQGIHRVPLLTWPQRCSRPLCSSQATGGPDLVQALRAHTRCVVQRETGPSRARARQTLAYAKPSGLVASEEATAPSGPNSVPGPTDPRLPFPHSQAVRLGRAVLGRPRHRAGLLVSVPLHEPISDHSSEQWFWATR